MMTQLLELVIGILGITVAVLLYRSIFSNPKVKKSVPRKRVTKEKINPDYLEEDLYL